MVNPSLSVGQVTGPRYSPRYSGFNDRGADASAIFHVRFLHRYFEISGKYIESDLDFIAGQLFHRVLHAFSSQTRYRLPADVLISKEHHLLVYHQSLAFASVAMEKDAYLTYPPPAILNPA